MLRLFCGLCNKEMEKLSKNDRIAILELHSHTEQNKDSPFNTVFRCKECGLFVYANLEEKKREI